MPRTHVATPVTPAQAQYVLERLLAERRIAPGEVSRYVREIQGEISAIEKRLAELRATTGQQSAPAAAPPTPRSGARATAAPRARRRKGNRLAGSYMGFMRQVPQRRKAKYQAIKQEKGFEAAIAALKADLGK